MSAPSMSPISPGSSSPSISDSSVAPSAASALTLLVWGWVASQESVWTSL